MSNRGDFVGTAPTSGNYIPAPTPAEQDDLPVYINDELLRLGGVVNGVLEGGSLPPHSELPKRVKEGMIMNFSQKVSDEVDSSGVWLYKKGKWWKLLDDPSEIIDPILKDIDNIEADLKALDRDLDQLNQVELPALNKELENLNDNVLPAVNAELASLEGKFPIKNIDIGDNTISAPKLQANSVIGDKILANSITGDKIQANTISGDKIVANSINGNKIVANSIYGDKLVANSIGADKLVANSITGNKISAATKITAGTGAKSASLDGKDNKWRLYAGSTTGASAPFRVDEDGNLFASSGTFGGEIYAKELSGEIASGTVVPYKGFTKSHDDTVKNFNQTYTLARFTVAPVISGGTVMPSSISTGNMGSVDWVVNGAGYDRTNQYLRVITVILENENTGQKYTKVIHNETFDGHSGFTDSISAVIPTLVLPVASTTNTYKVSVNIRWNLGFGTRKVSKASLVAGNMVVTRIVNTNTIKSI